MTVIDKDRVVNSKLSWTPKLVLEVGSYAFFTP